MSGHVGCPTGRANRGRGIKLLEPCSFSRQSVQVRRFQIGMTVAGQILPALIIRQEKDEVGTRLGFFGRWYGLNRRQREQQDRRCVEEEYCESLDHRSKPLASPMPSDQTHADETEAHQLQRRQVLCPSTGNGFCSFHLRRRPTTNRPITPLSNSATDAGSGTIVMSFRKMPWP